MCFYPFSSLSYLAQLLRSKTNGSAILEALLLSLLVSMILQALIDFEFKSKAAENKMHALIKEELSQDFENCSAEEVGDFIVSRCKKLKNIRFLFAEK